MSILTYELTPFPPAASVAREGLPMDALTRSLIVASLRELSDRTLQERFWLSDHEPALSSFSEAIERLFTDSGLAEALRAGNPGLSADADALLLKIEEEVLSVNTSVGPRTLLDDPAVERIRELARAILVLITDEAARH
jgi:hypothetical protein